MKNKKHAPITLALEQKASFGVGALLVGIALLYTYYVAFSIAYVVEREALVQKTGVLSEEVAGLEKEYLARSLVMTEKEALAHGLVPVTSRVFVERGTLTFGNR